MFNVVAFFDVFRKGSSVANVVKGKQWGALGGSVGVLIFSAAQAAKSVGYNLGIDNDTAMQIGVGVSAIAGVFVTYGTSSKVGILPAKKPEADVQAFDETSVRG